ncbi:MAG: shikimate dehydrogenase [Candidatus Omnitrophica bacterium]|nr:shikimate dehydrogenase [Candidatus Omnitrophota bacterium]
MKVLYGLIGWPLGHSLSPAIHNAAFLALGIQAEYRLFPLKPEEVDSFLNSLDQQGISGLNVTIPYKEKALSYVTLDKDSAFLKIVGAINTMVKRNGRWYGYNTDIDGFKRHIKEHISLKGKYVTIIGAGGAARAVSYVLAEESVAQIRVFDIEQKKAKAISEMIQQLFPRIDIFVASSLKELNIPESDILINATPLGLKENDPLPVPEEYLSKRLFVYDLIYNPPLTKLLYLAQQKGAQTLNGAGMLIYQGMRSFELWTGKRPPQDVMEKAFYEANQKKKL